MAVRDKHYNYSYSNDRNIILYNFNKVESFDPIGSFDEYEDCFSRKNTIVFCMGGKTKRAMLSERSEVGSRDVSVSYGAMS